MAATHHRRTAPAFTPPSSPACPLLPAAPLLQHKNEAKAFYAFLSQVYDYVVNPGHWSTEMREEALQPAALEDNPTELQVVDVGGGTGFCTQGIIKAGVPPTNITLIDQSPQQLDKARVKPDLQGVTILEVGGCLPGRPGGGAGGLAVGAGVGWLWTGGGLLVGRQHSHCQPPACSSGMGSSPECSAPRACPAACRVTPRTCPSRPTPSTDTSQQAA